jgi:hypothetical protein
MKHLKYKKQSFSPTNKFSGIDKGLGLITHGLIARFGFNGFFTKFWILSLLFRRNLRHKYGNLLLLGFISFRIEIEEIN